MVLFIFQTINYHKIVSLFIMGLKRFYKSGWTICNGPSGLGLRPDCIFVNMIRSKVFFFLFHRIYQDTPQFSPKKKKKGHSTWTWALHINKQTKINKINKNKKIPSKRREIFFFLFTGRLAFLLIANRSHYNTPNLKRKTSITTHS